MPDETLELVEEHLAMCDWCRDYLAQIEATAHAVAADRVPPDDPPADATLQALVGAFRAHTKGDAGP
jgi:predicted anti-sigma-YlaC factor YlaD